MSVNTDRIQAAAAILNSLVAALALAFVVTQINFAKEQFLDHKVEHRTDKIDTFRAEWVSPTMLFYRARTAEDYPHEGPHLVEVFVFFERLARARENDVIKLDDIAYYFQDEAMDYWYAFEKWVQTNRIQNHEDAINGKVWHGYQTLVRDLQAAEKLKRPTQKDIDDLMLMEQLRYVELHVVPPRSLSPAQLPVPEAKPNTAPVPTPH